MNQQEEEQAVEPNIRVADRAVRNVQKQAQKAPEKN